MVRCTLARTAVANPDLVVGPAVRAPRTGVDCAGRDRLPRLLGHCDHCLVEDANTDHLCGACGDGELDFSADYVISAAHARWRGRPLANAAIPRKCGRGRVSATPISP